MAKISKINLRQLFAKGLKPAQEAFYNFFDSYWHKDDLIDISAVKSLQSTLDQKLDSGAESTLIQAFENALGTAVQAKWSAVDVFEEYNNKVIKKLSAYVGGSGTPPTAHIGEYYKSDGGFTTDKDLAANFKENVTIIEPAQTTFAAEEMITGKNIANPAKKQSGKYVNWETGTIDPNPAYQSFVKLPVNSDTDYYFPVLFHIAWYDVSGSFISGSNVGGANTSLKSPAGAKFVSASFSVNATDIQIEKGTEGTPFVPYTEVQRIVIDKLSVNPSQTSFIKEKMVYGKNRFDKSKTTAGKYVNAFSGNLDANANYEASDFCDVSGLNKITLTSLIHIAFYTNDKTYISGREYGGDTIEVPTNAVWCRTSVFSNGMKETFQIETGENKTAYESFKAPVNGLVIDNLIVEGSMTPNPDTGIKSSIITPSVMYWMSGRQMNVYFDSAIYHPIADHKNNYYTSVFAYRGKFLQDKFRVVPTEDFNFKLKIENSKGQVKEKTTDVLVALVTFGNGVTRKILIIGDSTVNAGVTAKAIKDFFDLDVMKVTFLGTRETNGVKHEGRGGWTFNDYATVGRVFFKFNYPSGNVSKNSIYSVNGSEYTISEVNSGYFSAQKTSGTNNPPAAGTLTKVSGSGDATINYTSFELIDGNPFWNYTTSKFDLGKYLTDSGQTMGANDWVFIQLGINDLFGAALPDNALNVQARVSEMKTQLASMISEIQTYNSNIRIGILQTIPPAITQDATGNLLNSGFYCLEYYVKKGLVVWWNELLKTYDTAASRNNKVYLLGTTSIIDRVNNFPTITENLDSYNTTQVKVNNNDVHPDDAGYKQMADIYIGAIKYFQ
ncbi:hypothetical protein EGY05_13505 [Chryseobacterium arthrosphaerae]|uniref:SGNH/GDSL hydrolase family protein n=1 Tax=Chryseobacterium arthrosphaerae TaxID=651561 RepID=UPI000F5106EC|nr:SGNH/GDSL hydrolase family protein [Chryseobacterium arthrosphaerae]AYZ12877.1 hypothetical protein EGY05_13505 [Chryseobacterium arthrosphaerae]